MYSQRTIHYKNKQELIKNVCQELQSLKKRYKQDGIKKFFKRICIVEDKNGSKEEWCFTIYITDRFLINHCSMRNLKNSAEKICKFWSEDLKRSYDDEEFNVCENITMFREFLKREILKCGG